MGLLLVDIGGISLTCLLHSSSQSQHCNPKQQITDFSLLPRATATNHQLALHPLSTANCQPVSQLVSCSVSFNILQCLNSPSKPLLIEHFAEDSIPFKHLKLIINGFMPLIFQFQNQFITITTRFSLQRPFSPFLTMTPIFSRRLI